jgi:predicted acetyltransferase
MAGSAPLAELVRPSMRWRDSYRALVAEFTAASEKLVPFTLEFPHDDFEGLLLRLEACARGVDIEKGFVAHSTFWLVRDHAEVVGVANIRHALTAGLRREGGHIGFGIRPGARRQGLGSVLLRESLTRAAALGLARVLVTCAKSNVGSSSVITRNGGILESEEYLPGRGEIVQRYWIENGPARE